MFWLDSKATAGNFSDIQKGPADFTASPFKSQVFKCYFSIISILYPSGSVTKKYLSELSLKPLSSVTS